MGITAEYYRARNERGKYVKNMYFYSFNYINNYVYLYWLIHCVILNYILVHRTLFFTAPCHSTSIHGMLNIYSYYLFAV